VVARIAVLAAGTGSLFEALIDAPTHGTDFEITGFVTDQPDAPAIGKAATAGIPIAIITLADFADRRQWNVAFSQAIATYSPDFVVSAGFMRVISEPALSDFAHRIINTHPALLPLFPGAHAVRDALAAGVTETGSTVHLIDNGVDTGPVIAQRVVAVLPTDDESTLHERIKIVERELLVDVITQISRNEISLAEIAAADRKVSLQ